MFTTVQSQAQQRLKLHELLKEIAGTENVYFQPPSGHLMNYPAVRYNIDSSATTFADNNPYRDTLRYQVIVIDEDPDSEIPGKIKKLPLCRFSRFYAAEGLNHFVFNLYF